MLEPPTIQPMSERDYNDAINIVEARHAAAAAAAAAAYAAQEEAVNVGGRDKSKLATANQHSMPVVANDSARAQSATPARLASRSVPSIPPPSRSQPITPAASRPSTGGIIRMPRPGSATKLPGLSAAPAAWAAPASAAPAEHGLFAGLELKAEQEMRLKSE